MGLRGRVTACYWCARPTVQSGHGHRRTFCSGTCQRAADRYDEWRARPEQVDTLGPPPDRGRRVTGKLKSKQEMVKLVELAGRLDVSPDQAMLDMVKEAAWNVEFWAQRVRAFGENVEGQDEVLGRYDSERDRLMKYTRLALDAGIAERLVRIAERQGAAIVELLDQALDRLELSPEQRQKVPSIMGEILREVDGPAGPGEGRGLVAVPDGTARPAP